MNNSIFIRPEPVFHFPSMENIGPSPDREELRKEIQALMDEHIVLEVSPYILFTCRLDGRPALELELGRQREITFRLAGESTGKAYDIDAHDAYFEQLIIWDSEEEKLVGGYRFGCGDKIYETRGVDGFYISGFFEIDNSFHEFLPSCLELGRSFIVEEYQKKNLPLYLLWKGILAYQMANPQYRFLLGLVSISRFYSDFSRTVLMEFTRRHFFHHEFAKWFTPKTPFDPVKQPDAHEQINGLDGIPLNFEEILDSLRPEHIRFPVLMKQYIRQNARFLGFNLDPDFHNALDGLMILNIEDVTDNTISLLQRES